MRADPGGLWFHRLETSMLGVFLALPCAIAFASAPADSGSVAVPLVFVENAGQLDPSVRFVAAGARGALAVGDQGFVLRALDGGEGVDLRFSVEGAGPTRAAGIDRAPGAYHDLRGSDPARWVRNARAWSRVAIAEVAAGTDLELSVADGTFQYDLRCAPGTTARPVVLCILGHERLAIAPDGSLVIATALGDVVQRPPRAFATDRDGRRRSLPARASLLDANRVALAVDGAGPEESLLIDPVLDASAVFGPAAPQFFRAERVAADSAGFIYAVGTATGFGFGEPYPVTAGAFDATANGGYDGFVTKLDPSLGSVVYSTLLGGSDNDSVLGLAVDGNGRAIVSGCTFSASFPSTPGAYDPTFDATHPTTPDGFVAQLSADGSSLIFSTFIGGEWNDCVFECAAAADGSIVGAGVAVSAFLATPGSYDSGVPFAGSDALVFRLAAGGSSMLAATYYGADFGDEDATALALAADGSLLVGGITDTAATPMTAGAFDTTFNGGASNDYLARFDGGLASLLAATFYCGNLGSGGVTAIAAGPPGVFGAAGNTPSSTMPTTPGAFDTNFNTIESAFVGRFDAALDLDWSTFLEGTLASPPITNQAWALAIDSHSQFTVGGATNASNFPVTAGALDGVMSSGLAGYLTTFAANGKTLVDSSYLEGSGSDATTVTALAVLPGDQYAAAGSTNAPGFPTTLGALDADEGMFVLRTRCDGGFTSFGTGCPTGFGPAPGLAGTGCPAARHAISILLSGAPTSAAGVLFLGLGSGYAPVSGACSVEILPLLGGGASIAFTTSPAGALELNTALPGMVSPVPVMLQAFVADGSAPGGVAASRALQIDFAP